MDDGLVLRADVFRPVAEGRYPVILSYGPYGKGVAFQEGYKTAWEIMARENPDAVSGTTNKYAELGGGRSGEVGARRLRLHPRRFARRRPLARLPAAQRRARDARHSPVHRVGGGAALVERQGGHERHLLLRQQPVAGRGGAAAAPRGDLRLGGLGRRLPRFQPSWRPGLHVPQELAGHAGEDGAARRGRAGQRKAPSPASSSAAPRR